MILPALRFGGYEYETQVLVGDRIGGRKHRVDVLARKGDARMGCPPISRIRKPPRS
jgi:hypothetical protein